MKQLLQDLFKVIFSCAMLFVICGIIFGFLDFIKEIIYNNYCDKYPSKDIFELNRKAWGVVLKGFLIFVILIALIFYAFL